MPTRAPGRHRAATTGSTPDPTRAPTPVAGPVVPAGSRARPVVKAGALLVACSGLLATVGLQPSAASPNPSGRSGALGPLPQSQPAVQAAVQTAAEPGRVAATGRTTVAAEGPARVTRPLLIGSRAELLARGQLGQLGVGQTAAVPVVARPVPRALRPTGRTSRSAARRDIRPATTSAGPDGGRSDGTRSDGGAADATGAPTSGREGRSPQRRERGATTAGDGAGTDVRQQGTDQQAAGDGPGSASFGASVVAVASRYEGIAYRYGGTTPAGFDCSGFTSYVMAALGYDLPRTSGAQRAGTRRVGRSEAVAGDLVFMPGHVGIYVGDGMMIDSPRSGLSVSRRPVYSSSATYGRVG